MGGVGKRVGDELYVHISAVDRLTDLRQRAPLLEALASLAPAVAARVNVVKLNTRSSRVSLLEYAAFDDDAFPVLANSWTGSNACTGFTQRSYVESLNPPILHRKELLVDQEHPARARWCALTAEAEKLGLFDDTRIIGFRMNWERLIAAKGYQLRCGEFVPLANADAGGHESTDAAADEVVHRHRTALSRNAISAPVQLLLRHGLLTREASLFDYGCGRGDDVAALTADGFVASGWDPYYAADRERVPSDVVNVGFVINVIEDPAERAEVLHRAFALARCVMSVGVMLSGAEVPGRPYRDGHITLRGTFQKYFKQSELKDYLEHALGNEAILVGPGVAFVFKDKTWEQRFVVGRYRRTDVSARLLAARPRSAAPTRVRSISRRAEANTEAAKLQPLLERLWRLTLELGRIPDALEVPFLPEIERMCGLPRAVRRMSTAFDVRLLDKARTLRTEDLRLYFAMQQFGRRQRYRQLEPRVQRDIKAFFGDYASAQAAAMALLEQAADPIAVRQACHDAAVQGLGWLEEDHLQFHVALVERLPTVLRAFVSCALLIYGDLSAVDLVKVHSRSGKVTLMQFEGFSDSPLPLMSRRVKVNVRRADYDVFEYGHAFPKPLLYWKSRFMHEEMVGYVEQAAFDEALDGADVLGDQAYGPSAEELSKALAQRRLEVSGMRLRRSTTTPDVDTRCGARFTYRELIECGETRARLGLANIPRNPETFNALYDLAVKLLDPLVEYFGSIRLTYGFCSLELARHIKTRVAPALDQHAAHELNRSGEPICARGGAACDFIVEDEDMREVADWIIGNLPFDRLYFYGSARPIHLSYAPSELREATEMWAGPSGRLVPKRYRR